MCSHSRATQGGAQQAIAAAFGDTPAEAPEPGQPELYAAAHNFSLLRDLALKALSDHPGKLSLRRKRRRALSPLTSDFNSLASFVRNSPGLAEKKHSRRLSFAGKRA